MRYFLFLLLIPVFTFSQSKEDLVGSTWKIADVEIMNAPEAMNDINQPCMDKARLSFTDEFIVTESYNGANCDQLEETQQIEYKFSGKSLLSRDNPESEWETMEIESYSKEKMIIHQSTDGQTVIITLEKTN